MKVNLIKANETENNIIIKDRAEVTKNTIDNIENSDIEHLFIKYLINVEPKVNSEDPSWSRISNNLEGVYDFTEALKLLLETIPCLTSEYFTISHVHEIDVSIIVECVTHKATYHKKLNFNDSCFEESEMGRSRIEKIQEELTKDIMDMLFALIDAFFTGYIERTDSRYEICIND